MFLLQLLNLNGDLNGGGIPRCERQKKGKEDGLREKTMRNEQEEDEEDELTFFSFLFFFFFCQNGIGKKDQLCVLGTSLPLFLTLEPQRLDFCTPHQEKKKKKERKKEKKIIEGAFLLVLSTKKKRMKEISYLIEKN